MMGAVCGVKVVVSNEGKDLTQLMGLREAMDHVEHANNVCWR